MTAHEMTEPQAFRWIQRAAMDNRTSMRAVAELVLSGETGDSGQLADVTDADTPEAGSGVPAKPANPGN
jgi:hypothetical protein